jgi:membrane protein implicated in regulation of membrane protease activity
VEGILVDAYWIAAVFFSVLFGWQLLSTLLGGFGGAEHVDTGGTDVHDVGPAGGHDVQESTVHGADSMASFKLLSVRSVTAFGLLFGWAGILYTRAGTSVDRTLIYSVLWGCVGMAIVSALFYFLMRMAETGTRRLETCVGQRATVYMDIPKGGTGQVRTMVSGVISFVNARSVSDEALAAGTPVVVKRLLDANTVEVEKVEG